MDEEMNVSENRFELMTDKNAFAYIKVIFEFEYECYLMFYISIISNVLVKFEWNGFG